MSRAIILALLMILGSFVQTSGKESGEVLLSGTENAYNPIPNQDGSLIAYVRTGWGRPGGTGGLGRSNLRSEVMVMTAAGNLVTPKPLADAFLSGWTADNKNLICYRDWWYALASLAGTLTKEGHLARPDSPNAYLSMPERVTFLPDIDSMLWVQLVDNGSSLCTPKTCFARNKSHLGKIAVPSPNGRYIAIFGEPVQINNSWVYGSNELWIYDRNQKTWENLGKIMIHPQKEWDNIQPTWNPWSGDSSHLAFISEEGLVICSPDGSNRKVIPIKHKNLGLVVPSPNGKLLAYVSFEPRPMKLRADLKFWGGSTVLVVPVDGNSKPRAITEKSQDTTYTLRWLNNQQLVFDRIADAPLYGKARIWKANVSQ